ncbi:sensor histidine kinase [Streptomyces odontomachi]|uniref:sensor histidine kinase n=1 Tax=Streptomyces odontomachi TaxID=2944940 RepID=UPI0035A84C21
MPNVGRRPRPQSGYAPGGNDSRTRTRFTHALARARSLRARRPRPRRFVVWHPRRRSLRARLVVAAVTLIAVVCTVIGTVTTIALRSHLYEQLDDSLGDLGIRATGPPNHGVRDGSETGGGPPARAPRPPSAPSMFPGSGPLDFVSKGPQELGTIGATLDDSGRITRAVVSEEQSSASTAGQAKAVALTSAQRSALGDTARDGRPHTVDLPGLGGYRVKAVQGERGSYLVGLPTESVTNTLNTLVAVEVSVTGAGLLAASLAGAAIVGVALRPLRLLSATATRVTELPLHRGEVTLYERVPDAEADPATEVGQVGAAFNRMLDHVHEALDARQRSETRVRQFVADASHELRTPLASIRGYAELTRRGHEPTGPDTRHALGRIESEAHRMSGLVEDLLLLARLDAGRPLEQQAVDLSPIVVDALSDARAAGPGHTWRLALPDDPMLVRGDPSRLHQVLVNLLGNARTHTPAGSTVTARVRRDGAWIRLDVLDDGPGIPPDLLPYVFERFARGDASRARRNGAGAGSGSGADVGPGADVDAGPGAGTGVDAGLGTGSGSAGSTGLGLAIVYAVTVAHGGDVTVQSEPGRTVFTVRLPAEPVTELVAEPVSGTS